MRDINRISVFLEKIDFDFLENRWDIDISQNLRGKILEKGIREFWENNPDLRFGQMLINLNLIPDKFNIWNDEETQILIDQGISIRDIFKWRTYGKLGDQPLTFILLKDMSDDHIKNCIKNLPNLHPTVKEYFKDELNFREKNPQYYIEDIV
jgi:hypothetical protein